MPTAARICVGRFYAATPELARQPSRSPPGHLSSDPPLVSESNSRDSVLIANHSPQYHRPNNHVARYCAHARLLQCPRQDPREAMPAVDLDSQNHPAYRPETPSPPPAAIGATQNLQDRRRSKEQTPFRSTFACRRLDAPSALHIYPTTTIS